MDDSANAQTPFLGPQLPVYPPREEIVRVSAGSIGGNVYPAFLQQFVPGGTPGLFRDRIPIYVLEPNGIALGPGLYNATLLSSYLGLPLYSTTCCPTGTFGSASSGAA